MTIMHCCAPAACLLFALDTVCTIHQPWPACFVRGRGPKNKLVLFVLDKTIKAKA